MTDDHYFGELQFSLDGKVANHRIAEPTDVNLYLVWDSVYSGPENPGQGPYVAQLLKIEAAFPATFRFGVYGPPPVTLPRENYLPPPETYVTTGHFVAATADADFSWFGTNRPDHPDPRILGVDPRHVIEYMPDGLLEGSLVALARHGVFSPGYHMIDLKCISPAKAAEINACLEPYRANDGHHDLAELAAMYANCGSLDPKSAWPQASPLELQTELTVELIDDLEGYQPDPSECI